ncbi:hypothetical protein [Brenneria uluponensis]|uniref:hypothetical protein n=1 Tax=Brenneria uluponensis TaxID=3057057 RepID=UPI0028EF0F4C|nr:hypothetical protein [Brenneria ulupoensis]
MTSFIYKIVASDGCVLHNGIEEVLFDKIKNLDSSNVKFQHDGRLLRALKLSNEVGTIFAISDNKEMLKSSKLMRSRVNVILLSIPMLQDAYHKIKEETRKHINRLIHNLVTLNAHNIQEVYSIIPQEIMQDKKKSDWKETIIKQVTNEPYETSLSLVRVAKNTMKMKTEIDVYNTLLSDNPKINLKSHDIHRVIMNVMYVFFPDFTDNEIVVDVSKSTDRVNMDYETFHVAVYHIIENAVKYIKPGSDLSIYFSKDPSTKKLSIFFKMISLRIEQSEVDDIFIEGYSGEMARKSNRAGSGIGMYRAKSLLKHSNAILKVIPDFNTAHEVILGRVYQENVFVIEF